MKKTIAIAVAMVLCACSRTAPYGYEPPGPIVVPCPECVPEQGGEGGSSDGGTGAGGFTTAMGGGGGGEACDPHDVFVGSDGCFESDPLCCADLYSINLDVTCNSATEGALPIPVLCTEVPSLTSGVETDYRACKAVAVEIDCTWGPSTVLCCEP